MSDVIDQQDERDQVLNDARIKEISSKAELRPGAPGDCEYCGEWAGRLVDGACAPCRDRYKLP